MAKEKHFCIFFNDIIETKKSERGLLNAPDPNDRSRSIGQNNIEDVNTKAFVTPGATSAGGKICMRVNPEKKNVVYLLTELRRSEIIVSINRKILEVRGFGPIKKEERT